VQLLPSEQNVVMSADNLSEPGMLNHPKAARSSKASAGKETYTGARGVAGSKQGPHSRESGHIHGAKHGGRGNGDASESGDDKERLKRGGGGGSWDSWCGGWLREGIRVRVVNKHRAGGNVYLKKGSILCVTGSHSCNLQLDDGCFHEVRYAQYLHVHRYWLLALWRSFLCLSCRCASHSNLLPFG
jgi:hypothetical protein